MKRSVTSSMAFSAATLCAALLIGGAAARASAVAVVRVLTSNGIWGDAEEVPNSTTLNAGGDASIESMSCASAGNCSAGGFYKDGSGHRQVFVVNETAGTWGEGEDIPSLATLNAGGSALIELSCASAGNCSGGGTYEDRSDHQQAYVVDEKNGIWGDAKEVPGSGSLNAGGGAVIVSISCASAGNCSAGGHYESGTEDGGLFQAFVVNETDGIWGDATEVPELATLNAGGGATVSSVSCASAGNCSVGGFYEESSGHFQAFVVNETNGTWGDAEEVPNSATLNADGDADTGSVSCAAAGSCSAGGSYEDGSGRQQAFVVNETNGTWGDAEEVPGLGSLNTGGDAWLYSVSCASSGNCSAGGGYPSGSQHAFVVNETNGTWGDAEEVPGSATSNGATIFSVSCASAGNCSAGGSYEDSSGNLQALVVNETNGIWGDAEEVPGITTLNAGGNAWIGSVSCTRAGTCSAGGNYEDDSGHVQAFIVNDPPRPTVTALSPASGRRAGGTVVTVHGTSLTGASSVLFGTKPGTHVVVVNPDELKVTAPEGAGTVNVTVSTPGGTSVVSTQDRFFYIAPPAVTLVWPADGSERGGTPVTVKGTDFSFPASVLFGTRPGTRLIVVNPDELKVIAPRGSGTVSVTVTTLGGTSALSTRDRFTYLPLPSVTALSPRSGAHAGGTVVTVHGTHLTGATKVLFGTKVGTHLRVVNAYELRVTAPKGTGTVNVTVTTAGGTSAVSTMDRFRYA